MASQYKMLINGCLQSGKETLEVINPANEEVISDYPKASQEQVDQAVKSANLAIPEWSKNLTKRQQALLKAAELIKQNKVHLATILTKEQGKPLTAALFEVEMTANYFVHVAGMALNVNPIHQDDNANIYVNRRPVGVVAVIVPWNFPLLLLAKAVLPLIVGNTVVIKPSPYTPLASLALGKLLQTVFPLGVVNIISGDDEVGRMLTEHRDIKMITFTGSTRTGKLIALEAAKNFKRLHLELGGNDPAIILKECNVKTIAEKIFWGAFYNTGQVCTAIKRLYVHKNLYLPLIDQLKQIAGNIKIGDGMDNTSHLGPLCNKMQYDYTLTLVADSKKCGTIITGGQPQSKKGYFYPPTLITNIDDAARLVQEEQFSPVLPIMTFSHEAQVIDRANSTNMGLGASVWSTNLEHAERVAHQLQAGTVWINQVMAIHPQAPFGGMKDSGIGRVGGNWGLDTFSELQTINTIR